MPSGGKTSTSKSGKTDQRAARKARLAAALRQNLKRRKEQARQRAADKPPAAGAASQDTEQNSEVDDGTATGAPDFRRNRDEE